MCLRTGAALPALSLLHSALWLLLTRWPRRASCVRLLWLHRPALESRDDVQESGAWVLRRTQRWPPSLCALMHPTHALNPCPSLARSSAPQVAGNYTLGYQNSHDGGFATAAALHLPTVVIPDGTKTGGFYVAGAFALQCIFVVSATMKNYPDTGNCLIRHVSPAGYIATVS